MVIKRYNVRVSPYYEVRVGFLMGKWRGNVWSDKSATYVLRDQVTASTKEDCLVFTAIKCVQEGWV